MKPTMDKKIRATEDLQTLKRAREIQADAARMAVVRRLARKQLDTMGEAAREGEK